MDLGMMHVETVKLDHEDVAFLQRGVCALTADADEVPPFEQWMEKYGSGVILVKSKAGPVMALVCMMDANGNCEVNHLYHEGSATSLWTALNCAGRFLAPIMKENGVERVYTTVGLDHPKAARLMGLYSRFLGMKPEHIRMYARLEDWGRGTWAKSSTVSRLSET